jgi:hypothetical protein
MMRRWRRRGSLFSLWGLPRRLDLQNRDRRILLEPNPRTIAL